MGPSESILDERAAVVSQCFIDRGDVVTYVHRIISRLTANGVRGSVNLPPFYSSAGEQRAVHFSPVVSTRITIDLGRSSELTSLTNERSIDETPLMEILEKR